MNNDAETTLSSEVDFPFGFRHVLQQVKLHLCKTKHDQRLSKLKRKAGSKVEKNVIAQTMKLQKIGLKEQQQPATDIATNIDNDQLAILIKL